MTMIDWVFLAVFGGPCLLLIGGVLYDVSLTIKRAEKLFQRAEKHFMPSFSKRVVVEKNGENYIVFLNGFGAYITAMFDKETREMKAFKLSLAMKRLEKKYPYFTDYITAWLLHAKNTVIPSYEENVWKKKEREEENKKEREREIFARVNQGEKAK